MTDQPRDPATEVHRIADPSATRVASYLALREEVGRVLLLYSGGLDTSVMLKWIQDEYDAEVVALTVNLGQPGEDYEVVKGKALQLGALDCHVVDAREEFAREYVLPAIKANADYGDGYPLFTALGRPLIAKLAVEYARRTGCDTIAHGCTGKGNDQVNDRQTISLSRAQRSDGRNSQIIGGLAWSRASALSNSGDPFKPIHCPIRQTTEVEVRDGAVRHVARKVDECDCATGEHVVGTDIVAGWACPETQRQLRAIVSRQVDSATGEIVRDAVAATLARSEPRDPWKTPLSS
jgi:tRNA U34 2-thiouridine synthase MnmA/TrmU